MNIFGKGNVVNICAKRGGKTTIIVNGNVINDEDYDLKYERFSEKENIEENISSLILKATSEDVFVKKGNILSISYSGLYSGDKKPAIKKSVFDNEATVFIECAQFMSNSKVEITIPENVTNLKIKCTSGDISCVDEVENIKIKNIELESTSGDVETDCISEKLCLKSTSGDIRFLGEAEYIDISTTSGDIDVILNGGKNARFDSVSGDIEITAYHTTVNANLHTVSGKIRNKEKNDTNGVIVSVNTVSGDIELN